MQIITPRAIAELSYLKTAQEVQYSQTQIYLKAGKTALLVCIVDDWSFGINLQPDIYDLERKVFESQDPEWVATKIVEHTWPGKLARMLGTDLLVAHNIIDLPDTSQYQTVFRVSEFDDLSLSANEFKYPIVFRYNFFKTLHGNPDNFSFEKSELFHKIGHFMWASFIGKHTSWKII